MNLKLSNLKKTTGQLRSVFETVCAFLNNDGGTVLIGVAENNKILGQDVSDHTRQEIANEFHKIEPAATSQVKIDYVPVENGKFVVTIKVKSGNHVPYTYDGRAFQRIQSTTTRISQHHYEQLLVRRGQLNHSWEEIPVPDYGIDDLDHEEIFKTVSDGIYENRIPASAQRDDVEGVLKRLDLLKEGMLNRAAVVLYAKQEKQGFLHCAIKMARFKGLDKLGEFIDNQQFRCNAFQILEKTDAFLKLHLPIASYFKPNQFKRVDKPALPVMAVREALINAICHRDYASTGTDISLAIYDDRVEIWNSGDLLKDMTLQKLKRAHGSILRNKIIAHVFYSRGMIEKWGTGINKMIELCREDGLQDPEFEEQTGGLMVIFKFMEPIGGARRSASQHLLPLNNRQKEIMLLLSFDKLISAQEIYDLLKEPPSLRTVKADLSLLRKYRLIEQHGKGRRAMWRLKP